MKFVLINGPKRSGKTTLASLVRLELTRRTPLMSAVIGFSYHLKKFVHGIYLGEQGFRMDPDAFDATKEQPLELLGGMSWRQAYIHYSEKVVKPLHGDGWFGDQLVRASLETGADVVLVPDSGFRSEAERVVVEAGPSRVLLVRLHRKGCVYDSTDSRGYVSFDDLNVHEIDVEAVEEDDPPVMHDAVKAIVEWIRGS